MHFISISQVVINTYLLKIQVYEGIVSEFRYI